MPPHMTQTEGSSGSRDGLRRLRGLTLLALLVGVLSVATAQPVPAPAIAAQSWLLLDVTTGQVIATENADERREPASLTKLMTAYLTFAALRDKAIAPAQLVTVTTAAWRAEG
jgi:D-alanyl-D-alanine carboxypeptidase (penicillin-binding protein 5/6)